MSTLYEIAHRLKIRQDLISFVSSDVLTDLLHEGEQIKGEIQRVRTALHTESMDLLRQTRIAESLSEPLTKASIINCSG